MLDCRSCCSETGGGGLGPRTFPVSSFIPVTWASGISCLDATSLPGWLAADWLARLSISTVNQQIPGQTPLRRRCEEDLLPLI
jgi:hypothetical protein